MPAINLGSTVAWEADEERPVRYFSNSELQTWKECKRKWWLAYYRRLGLSGEKEQAVGPRQLGSRIHMTLEHYYTQETSAMEFLKSLYDEAEAWLISEDRAPDLEDLWKEYDLAYAMMEGYIQWVQENAIDEGYTLDAAEEVLEVAMPYSNVLLRGKLDQRWIRDSDQARLFRDFKTVGNLTSPTKMLHMDEQMKTYHLLEYLDALEKTGGEPQWRTDGALYTMLRKVKRTARANPPFYGQVEVRHNVETIRNMWKRVVAEIREVLQASAALDAGADHHDVAYPRPNGDCSWKCDFYAICSFFDDGGNADGMIEAYYEVKEVDARYNKEEGTKGDE